MKLRYFTCCLCTLLLFFTLLPASLAHAAPTQAGQITEYPLPSQGVPWGITSGPDGNLWFTYEYSKTIGRITTQGKIKEYPISACCPIDITSGPDGDLWFTVTYDNGDVATSYIGRITPQGKTTLHLLFTDFTHPWGITTGPDGNIWFTVYENEGEEDWNDYIGMMTPRGKSTLIPAGTFVHPFYITTGPDGDLWFTEVGAEFQGIVQYNPLTSTMTSFYSSLPIDITTGPDGDLWFTNDKGYIGRINPTTGRIAEYTIPTPNSEPWGITTGPDGNIWFTEYGGNKIGRINPNVTPISSMTEFAIPTPNSEPAIITTGPDGNLWFTESNGDKIGKITTS